MDFVTIASKGNAVDFGDLVDRHGQLGAGFANKLEDFLLEDTEKSSQLEDNSIYNNCIRR